VFGVLRGDSDYFDGNIALVCCPLLHIYNGFEGVRWGSMIVGSVMVGIKKCTSIVRKVEA